MCKVTCSESSDVTCLLCHLMLCSLKTDLISLLTLLLLFFFLLLDDLFKKSIELRCFKSDQDEIWQDFCYVSIDIVGFPIWCHTFQDSGHDIISRSKVLPPGEWTHSVYPASKQHRLFSSARQFLVVNSYLFLSILRFEIAYIMQ